jgi:transposase-like protein
MRHSPEQIVRKLREADAMLSAGKSVGAVFQQLGVSEPAYHRWQNQYGGMKAKEAKRFKQLEQENARLKKLVAEQALDLQIRKEVSLRNWQALLAGVRRCSVSAGRSLTIGAREPCTPPTRNELTPCNA